MAIITEKHCVIGTMKIGIKTAHNSTGKFLWQSAEISDAFEGECLVKLTKKDYTQLVEMLDLIAKEMGWDNE